MNADLVVIEDEPAPSDPKVLKPLDLTDKQDVGHINFLINQFIKNHRNEMTIYFDRLGSTICKKWEYFTLVIDTITTKEKYFIQSLPEELNDVHWRGWKFEDSNHLLTDAGFNWGYPFLDTGYVINNPDGSKRFYPNKVDMQYMKWKDVKCENDWPVVTITIESHPTKHTRLCYVNEDPVTDRQWRNSRFCDEPIYFMHMPKPHFPMHKIEGEDYTNLKHKQQMFALRNYIDDFVREHRNVMTVRFGLQGNQVHKDWEYFTLILKTPTEEEKYFIQVVPQHLDVLWRGWKFEDSNHLMTDSTFKWSYELLGSEFSAQDLDGLKCFSRDKLDNIVEAKTYLEIIKKSPDVKDQIKRERDWPVLSIRMEPDVANNDIEWRMHIDSVIYDHWVNSRFAPMPAKTYSTCPDVHVKYPLP